MNKAKQLKKSLIKSGGITGVIVAVAVAAMVGTGMMAGSATERKTAAENARNQDSGTIATMKGQIEQSGTAAKRFVEIQLTRSSTDFSANSEALKEWLRLAKDRYRFANNFKLTLALEKDSDKPEFSTLNYLVKVREPIKLEFGAISDMHVYAFLQDLLMNTPGFVKITRLDIKRRNDMDATSYRQFLSGLNTDYVIAVVEFTWVGIEEKPAATDPNAQPAAGGM